MSWALHTGDCFEVLPTLAAELVDAVVTDPPYGIGMMGKEWDVFRPDQVDAIKARKRPVKPDETNPNLRGRAEWWGAAAVEYDRSAAASVRFQEWTREWATAVLRVLKPGAHVVVCASPRMAHRVTCGLEDAGFEIRDTLVWLHGQGFPKSLNLGDGRGTALKPAYEPIILARKPCGGTVTACVEKHGTGALNIDACRFGGERWTKHNGETGGGFRTGKFMGAAGLGEPTQVNAVTHGSDLGRWPPNVALDEAAADALDTVVGEWSSGANPTRRRSNEFATTYGMFVGQATCRPARGSDAGPVSRFFYCPKASRPERERGCEDLPLRTAGEVTGGRQEGSAGLSSPRAGAGRTSGARNGHPTCKPLALMRWLVRLITPPGGLVLDPFTGSGTTGIACILEDRGFIGIEREAEYVALAQARIAAAEERFETGGPLLAGLAGQ